MTGWAAILGAATAMALVAIPSGAQEGPPVEPTQDYAVTYRTIGAAGSDEDRRVSWWAAGRVLRLDVELEGEVTPCTTGALGGCTRSRNARGGP